jgi:hypothetical protein
VKTLRESAPLWADAAEILRRWEDPDPQRHDLPGDEAEWPEVVNDRCRICGQVVEEGCVECNSCFEIEDTAARRREDR